MSKSCPNCGKEVPDEAKFCMDCGHNFEANTTNSAKNSILGNGKIFLVIIAIVVILGLLAISLTGNNTGNTGNSVDDVEHVDLTITGVGGWESESGKKSYTLYTDAIFNSVPDDLKGYNVKTTYYDANNSQIGYETEKLENIYYDSEYSLSLSYYTTYKLPDPDHVTVEIIKNGKVIDNYTEKIDTNKISFLN